MLHKDILNKIFDSLSQIEIGIFSRSCKYINDLSATYIQNNLKIIETNITKEYYFRSKLGYKGIGKMINTNEQIGYMFVDNDNTIVAFSCINTMKMYMEVRCIIYNKYQKIILISSEDSIYTRMFVYGTKDKEVWNGIKRTICKYNLTELENSLIAYY